jgi:glutamate 5-kinase
MTMRELIPEVTTYNKGDRSLCGGNSRRPGNRRDAQQDPGGQRKSQPPVIPMIIAKGQRNPIYWSRLFEGQRHGTYFVPKEKKLPSRKCWIAYTLKPKGSIIDR